MAAFLHIHLKQIAQIVHAGRGLAEQALLLHAGRLGIALRDDQPPQHVAVFAGHLLPHGQAEVIAEAYAPVMLGRRQEDAPAVIGHLHIIEMRPSPRFHGNGRAQIHVVRLVAFGTHIAPPLHVIGEPVFERPQEALIVREIDVVRNSFVEGHQVLRQLNWGRSGLP